MKHLVTIITLSAMMILNVSISVYALDPDDLLNKPDSNIDTDTDFGETLNKGLDQVGGFLQGREGALRNTNSEHLSKSQDMIVGGRENLNNNIHAINGSKNNQLKTVTGKPEARYKPKDCRSGQESIASLTIPNGNKSTSISISMNMPSKYDFQFQHVYGVCDNKFTVCNIEMNKKICNEFYKTAKEAGKEDSKPDSKPGDKTMVEVKMEDGHVCNHIIECMSWRFATDNGTRLTVKPAGNNCSFFAENKITVSQKDMIIQNLSNPLRDIAKTHNLGALSDVKKDGVDNTNTEYLVLQNNCGFDNKSKPYMSGMTNLSDLTKYYDNNKDIASKTDEDRKKQHNDLLSQNPMGQRLDNSSKKIESFQKDNATYKNKFDNIGGKLGKTFDAAKDKAKGWGKIPSVCYTPNCTVDIEVAKTTTPTASDPNSNKTYSTKERVFRNCVAVGLETIGSEKKTKYQCPVKKGVAGITETMIAQPRRPAKDANKQNQIKALDNSIIQDTKDGKIYCSCYNEHQQGANLQKVMVATKLAEQINSSACGDNEYDNETRTTIKDKRSECKEKHKEGTEEYRKCLGESKK